MMSFGLITDFILVAMLAATLFYVLKLLRRLGDLHKDRESFQKLIQDFTAATAQADRALADLRIGADGVGRELGERIGKGQSVIGELQRSSDDLKMLIARAENAADKLETHLGATRSAAPAAPKPRTEGEPTGGAQDPQTQALLSALGRIR
jgi:septal ring factor EnvC (AmiA/AmiB activator)